MFTRDRVFKVGSRVSQIVTLTAIALAAATVLTVTWFAQVQHEQLLVVTSSSMAPTFDTGAVVRIAPVVDRSKLHAGQVVTFGATRTHSPTTHRILSVVAKPDGTYLQTKGDANTVEDSGLTPVSSVTGVMTGSIPLFGRWLMFYQAGMGKALLLGIPLGLIVIGQLRSLFGGRRRREDTAAATSATT